MSNIGMYRPYKVMVSKDVTVDATGLSDLADGELCVVATDGTLLVAGETVSDSEWIYIAQGTATAGEPLLSPRIKGAGVTKWVGNNYAAAAQQVSYVGYNGTTGAVTTTAIDTGDVLKLRINFPFDKEFRSLRTWSRYFEYTAIADDSGAAAVTDLVAQINADSVCSQYLTAAVTTDGATARGISLTAIAQTHSAYDNLEQVYFEVFLDGDDWESTTYVDQFGYIEAATRTTTNSASINVTKGVGTYDQVLDMERFAVGFWGQTNRTKFPVINIDTYALSTEGYDLYMIEWTDDVQANDLSWNRHLNQIVVAIPYDAAAGNGAAFEALMNPWMASCPGAFSALAL